jgi:hypothetical protein
MKKSVFSDPPKNSMQIRIQGGNQHGKMRKCVQKFKTSDPDPHFEYWYGSRRQIECGSGTETQVTTEKKIFFSSSTFSFGNTFF